MRADEKKELKNLLSKKTKRKLTFIEYARLQQLLEKKVSEKIKSHS